MKCNAEQRSHSPTACCSFNIQLLNNLTILICKNAISNLTIQTSESEITISILKNENIYCISQCITRMMVYGAEITESFSPPEHQCKRSKIFWATFE